MFDLAFNHGVFFEVEGHHLTIKLDDEGDYTVLADVRKLNRENIEVVVVLILLQIVHVVLKYRLEVLLDMVVEVDQLVFELLAELICFGYLFF